MGSGPAAPRRVVDRISGKLDGISSLLNIGEFWNPMKIHSVGGQWLRVLVGSVLGIGAISCNGTAEGLVPVIGKLMCDGEPAAGAVLLFQRQAGSGGGAAGSADVVPSAITREDGTFRVESHPLGDGAGEGKYVILVRWPEESSEASPPAASKLGAGKGKTKVVIKKDKGVGEGVDRLKGRYMNAAKPVLLAEIKPGVNDLGTLEVSRK